MRRKKMRYKTSSIAAEKIITKIHKKFRQNRLTLFDEMNILQVKKHVSELYKSSYNTALKEYENVANSIYQEIYDEAVALGFEGDIRDLDEAWVEEFFDEYNPVTKYVFSREMDRKKSRLFEALIASKAEKFLSYKTAEGLLTKQIKQSSIDLEDEIAKTVFKDLGVKKVKWIAEDDHKTCSVCNELDGQIFNLNDAPPKQHYQCRCWLTPVK
jgi:SPP1 gp7 family putative phage head morphogenesis protein